MRADLVGDGAWAFCRHHEFCCQEVHQDVGDICTHGLQDVLHYSDLGLVCAVKAFQVMFTIGNISVSRLECFRK